MNRRLVTLLVASSAVTSCAYNGNKGEDWIGSDARPLDALNLTGHCEGVDGSFLNAGAALRDQVVQNPSLAQSVFRLGLLGKDGVLRQAHSVTLTVDPGAKILRVTIAGDAATREWIAKYECSDGWMHVRDDSGKQYLGDGYAQEWSKRQILLAMDTDGNLVTHITSDLEYRVFLGGKHRSYGESWYIFQRRSAGADQRGQSH
ncbi:MAG: hypothetical protein E6Q43_05390 [Dokdonella sp.]|nr:MAG: hypothetical protein E6Q43_05390 [Dokdonella sp.]